MQPPEVILVKNLAVSVNPNGEYNKPMGIPREPRAKSRGLRRDYTRAPQISKTYLLGLLHDATERPTTFRIAQKNKQFLDFIKSELEILGAKSWIYKEGKDRNVWILEFSKKFLEKAQIINIQDKIDYLRGYFDAEGGIAKSSKVRFYLYYCQKSFDELVQLKKYLAELKISCGVIHNPSKDRDPDFWRFYIAARSYRDFAKKIGSFHPDKSEILRMKI